MRVTLQPESTVVVYEPQSNPKCPECDAVLPPRKRPWQVYCSDRCRLKAYRAGARRARRVAVESGAVNDRNFPPRLRAALVARRNGAQITRPEFTRNPAIDPLFLTAWAMAGEYAARQRPQPLPVTDADARAAGIDD